MAAFGERVRQLPAQKGHSVAEFDRREAVHLSNGAKFEWLH